MGPRTQTFPDYSNRIRSTSESPPSTVHPRLQLPVQNKWEYTEPCPNTVPRQEVFTPDLVLCKLLVEDYTRGVSGNYFCQTGSPRVGTDLSVNSPKYTHSRRTHNRSHRDTTSDPYSPQDYTPDLNFGDQKGEDLDI